MPELLIGAAAAVGAMLLLQHVRRRDLRITWWQWLLTFLGFAWAIFVAEVVVSFLREGFPKGAAVMGTLLGFAGVVWGVLLARYVFRSPGRPESASESAEVLS